MVGVVRTPNPEGARSVEDFSRRTKEGFAASKKEEVSVSRKESTTKLSKQDTNVKIVDVVKPTFEHYPDLSSPKAKMRGLTTSNLTKETGFFLVRWMKYAFQILEKSANDIHKDFRAAVNQFNKEKNETNLDKVINQIRVLKSQDTLIETDESVKQIANEALLYKFQMLRKPESTLKFDPNKAEDINSHNFQSQKELQNAITTFNQHKTEENLVKIIDHLATWRRNDPQSFSEHYNEIGNLFYEMSSGIKDQKIYEVFSLLRTDRSQQARQKLQELEEKYQQSDRNKFGNKNLIDISKVKKFSFLSSTKSATELSHSIAKYNKTKSSENLHGVIKELQRWQFKHSNSYGKSNSEEIISEISDILQGTTKQDKIKKSDGYQFLQSTLEGFQKSEEESIKAVPQWNVSKWKPLSLSESGPKPSTEFTNLKRRLDRFNHNLSQKKPITVANLQELSHHIDQWIQIRPDEFNRYGGNNLLNTLQANILGSISAFRLENTIDTHQIVPKSIHELTTAIQDYNSNRTEENLNKLKELFSKIDPASKEYKLYHLNDFKRLINKIDVAKPESYPQILLPSTHPPSVFERSLAFKQEAGKNAFLTIFHNPVMPWSHSEISFVEGAKPVQNDSFVEHTRQHKLNVCKDVILGKPPSNPKDKTYHAMVKLFLNNFNRYRTAQHDQSMKEYHKTLEDRYTLENEHKIKQEAYLKAHQVYESESKNLMRSAKDFMRDDLPPDARAQDAEDSFNFLKEHQFIDQNGMPTARFFAKKISDTVKEERIDTPFSESELDFMQSKMPAKLIAPVPPAELPPFDPPVPPAPLSTLTPEDLLSEIEQEEATAAKDLFKKLKEQDYFSPINLPKSDQVDPDLLAQIDQLNKGDPENAAHIKGILLNGAGSVFNENSFSKLTEEQSQKLFEYLRTKDLLVSEIKPNGEIVHFLKEGWEAEITHESLPEELKFHRAHILAKLQSFGVSEQISKREHMGIGANQEDLESYSQHAEGVRIDNEPLVQRLDQLCRRRKNEIQTGINVFAGAAGGVRSLGEGMYATLLVTEEDKKRHFKQALIDNFLTSVDPKSFLPDLEEPRYRLELHESGGIIYKKWIEDPNGQFSKVKSPSSRDQSGKYIEGDYKKNSYALVNGKLKSIKTLDKEKLKDFERGNVIHMSDGTKRWEADKEGQYFKRKEDPIDKAEQDTRPLYPAMNCERYLRSEAEWCGSYVIRMLHSAYAFEFMPEFQPILKKLRNDFEFMTSFKGDAQFEKRHAKILFDLAEKYADLMVSSEAGRKYFRDMNPTVKLSPRCTPDMIHQFLMGKQPGIVNSLSRAWKTLQLPQFRDFEGGASANASFSAGKAGIGILGLPTALLKLVFGVISAVTGYFINIPLYGIETAKSKQASLERESEAGIKTSGTSRAFKIIGHGAGGVFIGVFWPLKQELDDIWEVVKNIFKTVAGGSEKTAFSDSVTPLGEKAKKSASQSADKDSVVIHATKTSDSRPKSSSKTTS